MEWNGNGAEMEQWLRCDKGRANHSEEKYRNFISDRPSQLDELSPPRKMLNALFSNYFFFFFQYTEPIAEMGRSQSKKTARDFFYYVRLAETGYGGDSTL